MNILARLFKTFKPWQITIMIDGLLVIATVFDVNEHGMWHVSYKSLDGMHKNKWITPTPEQRASQPQP
jgi:hypothetical protein